MFQFDRIACISLKRRPDRWEQFLSKLPEDWPFKDVEMFDAIDGDRCPSPSWWNAGGGAWGCYKSHYNILEQCIQQGIESCLFLEDDAVCCDGFTQKIETFLNELPDDWGMVYLGGQHLHTEKHPPVRVSEHVYIPYNVNRTHAFAIRGKKAMNEIYNFLNETRAWHEAEHIDHHLGRLHERRELPIYSPSGWLIGQDEGQSNISGQMCGLRYFPPATDYGGFHGEFVAILGAPNSGAEQVARIANELGLYGPSESITGDAVEPVVGRHGEHDIQLPTLCDSHMPMPSSRVADWEGNFRCRVVDLIRRQVALAKRRNTIAFGFAPQLAACGDLLESSVPNNLKVISVDRDIDGLLDEARNEFSDASSEDVEASIQFLERQRVDYLEKASVPVLSLDFAEINESPEATKSKVAEFLGRKF